MEVAVVQKQKDLPISSKSVKALVLGFLKCADISYDEVTIHFIDDKAMCKLHEEYFDDPTPTDCISFPMDEMDEDGYRVMGDVFVCPATAISYVKKKEGHSKADFYKETTLYVIHGLLHLIGYDDIDEEDRKEMKLAEKRYLDYAAKHNLLLT